MWFLFLALSANAADPPVFEPLHSEGACDFSRSTTTRDGFPVLRAECRWPELDPARLDALLGDWAGHQHIWSMVTNSQVIEQRERDTLVRHVHQAPAMVDREILLRMWVEEIPGGHRYSWTRAEPQPPPGEGRVGVVLDDGMYTVLADGAGTHLVSTLCYDPGGYIPDALVRWFQVLGMPRFLEELREAATTGPSAPH
jgi:hypothetical protein